MLRLFPLASSSFCHNFWKFNEPNALEIESWIIPKCYEFFMFLSRPLFCWLPLCRPPLSSHCVVLVDTLSNQRVKRMSFIRRELKLNWAHFHFGCEENKTFYLLLLTSPQCFDHRGWRKKVERRKKSWNVHWTASDKWYRKSIFMRLFGKKIIYYFFNISRFFRFHYLFSSLSAV